MHLGEQLRPLHDLGRGRLGSGEGGMLVLLHELLLSCETSAVGIRTNSVSHLKVKLVTCVSGVLKKAIAQLIKCNCSAYPRDEENDAAETREAMGCRSSPPNSPPSH